MEAFIFLASEEEEEQVERRRVLLFVRSSAASPSPLAWLGVWDRDKKADTYAPCFASYLSLHAYSRLG